MNLVPERTRILEVVGSGEQEEGSLLAHSACPGGPGSKQRGETGAGETSSPPFSLCFSHTGLLSVCL